jgi:hypothetical protein
MLYNIAFIEYNNLAESNPFWMFYLFLGVPLRSGGIQTWDLQTFNNSTNWATPLP